MSSLAAAKADSFYRPPEWTPEMGSISKFQGSKGANQFEKYGIIRFELPFDAWCLGCSRHMSKGLRFNAKKEKAGKYFSTPIYSFDMKCYSCDQRFIIKTDPQNSTYEFVSGLRKHEQDYEANVEDGVVEVGGNDELRQRMQSDPMYRLQHLQEDDLKAKAVRQQLVQLEELQRANTKEDYDRNAALRRVNRLKRKQEETELREGKRRGLNMRFVGELTEAERKSVQEIQFGASSTARAKEHARLAAVRSQSIFAQQQPSFKSAHGLKSKSSDRRQSAVVRSAQIRTDSSSLTASLSRQRDF